MTGRGLGFVAVLLAALPSVPNAQPTDIALPSRFAPESIAASADGTIYIGSTVLGAIYRARPGQSRAEPFVPEGTLGLLSVEGIAIDERACLLWACSADLGLRSVEPKPASGLRAFDLATGALRSSLDLPGGGFCNDVALDASGRPWTTDSINPRILRASPDGTAMEEWLRDPALGGPSFQLNGIAFDGPGTLWVDKSASGALLRIGIGKDGRPGTITPIRLSAPIAWPDAIRVLAPGRLLIFDSPVSAPGRILMAEVADGDARVTVLADGLDAPSSGVISMKAIRFIESRFAHWFDPVRKTQPPAPFAVRSIPVPH